LESKEAIIIKELLSTEGNSQDIGGYYFPNLSKTIAVMRPSATMNAVINGI